MLKKGIVAVGLFLMTGAAPAFAQSARVEVSGFVGWSLSDGVETDVLVPVNGQVYGSVEPKDSAIYGFTVGVLVGEGAEVGFRWAQQPTQLVLGGVSDLEVGDMKVSSYHGYFAYNFGEVDAPIRPFVLIGMGATNFGGVDASAGGISRNIGGETQFSTTWAGGVKIFPSPHVGVRLAAEWTPTYIKTDSEGWWCDPYWGCYVVGNAQYSNSFQFNGGVTIRF